VQQRAGASGRIAAVQTLEQNISQYIPRPGLSIPIVTILDGEGRLLEDEQRAVVRFAIQDGAGADIIFAAGTNGEWDRIDNPRRQAVARIAVEECRRANARAAKKIEAWAGVTAPTRAEALANLAYAVELNADAAVIAPLSIADVEYPVKFVERDVGALFNRMGRMIPVFLYDNADIAAPGKPAHLHTRDVKEMSRLPYVRGVKVTASKTVIGNYTRAASHFKASHEFAIYAGNAYLIFDLFAPPENVGDRIRYHWNRYLTQRARPYGVVSGPANAMPREWQRAWQVCRSADTELMGLYAAALETFRDACTFKRAGKPYRPTIACLKTALKELGVIESDAVGAGTPTLNDDERREFVSRSQRLREHNLETLERGWVSEPVATESRASLLKMAHRNG
jgi:dihydrodipicolinate synthase/N-acetylneuraminate lyase